MTLLDAIRLDPLERRRLALAALVDERTLVKYLAGVPVRGLCRERISAAFAALERARGLAGNDREAAPAGG